VGCIAGAISVEEYRHGLLAAGFEHVDVRDTNADLNAYLQVEGASSCCAAPEFVTLESQESTRCCGASRPASADQAGVHTGLRHLLSRFNVNDYVASARIYAVTRREDTPSLPEAAAP
jgi:arsenite methyltransferase